MSKRDVINCVWAILVVGGICLPVADMHRFFWLGAFMLAIAVLLWQFGVIQP